MKAKCDVCDFEFKISVDEWMLLQMYNILHKDHLVACLDCKDLFEPEG